MERFRHRDVTSAIGETPIVRLHRVARDFASEIYVKLELTNPGGSIKDRVGVYMCRKAAEQGRLRPGAAIVEATSGNTGIGVAIYAATRGHPCVFVMSDKQSRDKVAQLKAFGAHVVICPASVATDDPRSHFSVARGLARALDGLYLNQHDNPDNAEAHYVQTGPEIFRQTEGAFDVLVAGVGTGGTISGTGRFLKEHMPALQVIGVDPVGSVLAGFHASGHAGECEPFLLEGIGDKQVPGNLDVSVIDAFEVVADADAFAMARRLLREEGIYAGGSSGAAVCAALRVARRSARLMRILVILPESGSRHISRLYNDEWMMGHGFGGGDLRDRGLASLIRSCIGDDGVRLA